MWRAITSPVAALLLLGACSSGDDDARQPSDQARRTLAANLPDCGDVLIPGRPTSDIQVELGSHGYKCTEAGSVKIVEFFVFGCPGDRLLNSSADWGWGYTDGVWHVDPNEYGEMLPSRTNMVTCAG